MDKCEIFNITVLMSTYNGEKYIREQLESILGQEQCAVKVLVRDDGSTDGTAEILEEYAQKGDLKFFTGNNLGPAKSFLTLILESSDSDYYAFSDQDDVWENNKLLRGVSFIKADKDKPSLYFSDMRRVNDSLSVISEKTFDEAVPTDFESVITGTGCMFGCTMVFNRSMATLIKSKGIPNYIIMHDVWLGSIAALYGSLFYDDNPSYINYRVHGNNYTIENHRSEGLRKKLINATKENKECFSLQCKEFVNYMGKNEIMQREHFDICETLINYKSSLIDKIKLFIIVILKKEYTWKQKIFQVFRVAFNTF